MKKQPFNFEVTCGRTRLPQFLHRWVGPNNPTERSALGRDDRNASLAALRQIGRFCGTEGRECGTVATGHGSVRLSHMNRKQKGAVVLGLVLLALLVPTLVTQSRVDAILPRRDDATKYA